MIKQYHVASLAEFYNAITAIESGEKDNKDSKKLKQLWFRGHGYNHYSLMPTLLRDKYYDVNGLNTYAQTNLKEDYRYQHFKARVYHSIKSGPSYQNEWQEIYQHHFGHTRLMDWTESARTALIFSLESFIDTRKNKELEFKRNTSTPCIWVLNPCKLNECVYNYMAYNSPKVIEMFRSTCDASINFNELCREIKNNKNIYFEDNDGDITMNGILNLCAIEDYRNNLGSNLKAAVKSFEFNPFYYLALRTYSDAVPVVINDINEPFIPPIALLHPYHSERIRAQRGAFTMFPNYILKEKAEQFSKKRKIDIRAMERQTLIESCISVIYIIHPNQVAYELLASGERRSEVYPDIQTYADILETSDFYY